MDEKKQREVRTRVNRIAGQVSGIQRMIDEDAYCVKILDQIAAVRSALDVLGVQLLTAHVESCVLGHGTHTEHACARPMTQEQLLVEMRTALSRFLGVKQVMDRTTFSVPDIECDGCANAIKNALGKVEGITAVQVDVPGKSVTVTHDEKVSRETVSENLEKIGFPVVA